MEEQKTINQAVKDEFLDLTRWANNMIRQLQANFETQHVWPGGFPGPYIGYRNTPAAKKSTGQAYRRMYAKVFNGAGGDTKKISFFFNYYLYFVDMGVGAGQPIEDVDRDEFAHYKKLYKKMERRRRPPVTTYHCHGGASSAPATGSARVFLLSGLHRKRRTGFFPGRV